MEVQEVFAIGVGPRKKTPAEKRAAYRKKMDIKRKERMKKESKIIQRFYRTAGTRAPEYPTVLGKQWLNLIGKQWLILPDAPTSERNTIYWAGKNIVEIMVNLRKKNDKASQKIAIKNQRLRNAFSALARRWLLKRAKQGNDEDLVTGDVPVNPVILFDWKSRTKYVFEASTIRKDIVSRLLNSTACFYPKPLTPRNPYTNMPVTLAQFYSIVRQLRARGCTHWTIEALYSTGYYIDIFQDEMYRKLKNTILKNLFTDHGNSEGISVVLDFIEDRFKNTTVIYEGENVGIIFEEAAYRWALENRASHPHICAWRSLAYEYHKIATQNSDKEENIVRQARALCLASDCIKKLFESSSSSNSSNNTP